MVLFRELEKNRGGLDMQEVENIYGASVPAAGRSTTTEMMVSRQAQEVQAAMVCLLYTSDAADEL